MGKLWGMGFCRHVDVVHNLEGAAPLHQIFGVNAEKRKVQLLVVKSVTKCLMRILDRQKFGYSGSGAFGKAF